MISLFISFCFLYSNPHLPILHWTGLKFVLNIQKKKDDLQNVLIQVVITECINHIFKNTLFWPEFIHIFVLYMKKKKFVRIFFQVNPWHEVFPSPPLTIDEYVISGFF